MLTRARLIAAALLVLPAAASSQRQQQAFTLEQVRSYPFPTALTAAGTGTRIAWAFNERGLRNVWVADGPAFAARQYSRYTQDDGQEITSLSLSNDGRWVVYVRGGEHGGNWQDIPPNPLSHPVAPRVQIWAGPFDGEPKVIADGDYPSISPRGDMVAFLRDNQPWIVPIDGSAPARRWFFARGSVSQLQWSPDGARLAFVSNRGTHALIGVFENDSTPVRWLAPTSSRDASPRWSPDGQRIAFVRRPGGSGVPDSVLVPRHQPWSIWVADAAAGSARQIWKAPETLRGSVPTTHGGTNLHYAAGGRIVFLSYQDGWPHLYSVPEAGGAALQLTRGNFMAEYISMSPDRRFMVFAGNTGPRADDIDRRHIVRVPVDRAAQEVLTPGTGLEWTPVYTGDGASIAFIGATAQRPPLPMVMAARGGAARVIAENRIPADYPASRLVTPRQVIYEASDGVRVHAQVFEAPGGPARKPAIIYVHGGPPRQMLLGWHYSDYYSNAYALNQYLANRGYVVMSINFRLGIGYGYEFHRPRNAGAQGASEYLDVKAAGEWLRRQANVDPERIGIYGGSYGGFLTALALGRDSDLFKAGVDIHGVHDWTTERARGLMNQDRYEVAPDVQHALETAWQSSPNAWISTWKSPVLLIHGDDDRNVRFAQTADLTRRLEAAGIPFEELVVPDDTHSFHLFRNILRVNAATAEFFDRHFSGTAVQAGGR